MVRNIRLLLEIIGTVMVSYSIVIVIGIYCTKFFVPELDVNPGLNAFFIFNIIGSISFLLRFILKNRDGLWYLDRTFNWTDKQKKKVDPLNDRIPRKQRDKKSNF
jgi:hypothetical protein